MFPWCSLNFSNIWCTQALPHVFSFLQSELLSPTGAKDEARQSLLRIAAAGFHRLSAFLPRVKLEGTMKKKVEKMCQVTH
jgi:hypothetical protein